MNLSTNKFGTSWIAQEDDLKDEKIFIYNCACLTIHTEVLGWANKNKNLIVTDPSQATIIIVLGCQVTDIAILNDTLTAEEMRLKYPQTTVFIGGCLGQRFDIPVGFPRVDLLEADYEPIVDNFLITWQPPFWDAEEDFLRIGVEAYIRVGKGCHGKCSYCTIRETRKEYKVLDMFELGDQIEELGSEYCYIVPTCDTLSSTQIRQLLHTTEELFLRNVEPSTLIKSTQDIVEMCEFGNLVGIHVPIQSLNSKVLESMNRNPDHVYESLFFLKWLKEKYHVKIATNIISGFDNIIGGYEPKIDIYKLFDHVAVNPYWDGVWDRQKAETRMLQFVPQYKVNIV